MRRVQPSLQVWTQRARCHPGAVLAMLACLGGCLIAGAFVTDDALITLRYARHFAQGLGVRWNPGQDPVEGYTNFSHVLLGAAALQLGLPALWVLKLINLAAIVALCPVSYALTLRGLGSKGWATAAALLVGVHPPLWYWAASGLETGLYTLAVYWAVLQAHAPTRRGRAWTSVPLLLASLTRFEGPVVALAIFGAQATADVMWPPRERVRQSLVWLVPFALLYAGYFAWRVGYFGYLMPNSAYFKADIQPGQEGRLFWEFAAENALLLGIAVLPPWRKLGVPGLCLFALVMAYVIGFYSVRPSISYMHRFYLPALPAVAILATASLWRLGELGGRLVVARAAAVALVLWALIAEPLHFRNGAVATYDNVLEKNSRILTRTRVARFVRANFAKQAKVAMGDVGVTGYLMPQALFDTFGLNDEAFVHRFARDRKRYLRDLFARNRPEAVVVVSRSPELFKRRYSSDGFIMEHLVDGYRLVHRELSPTEGYHYFVYARPDVKLRGARLGPEQATPLDAVSVVETAALRLR
jgi:arabinofuranosyltransferase